MLCYGMTQPSNQEKLKHPLCIRKQSPAHQSSCCCSTVTSQETEYSLLMQKGALFHSCFYALLECITALLKSQASALTACTSLFILCPTGFHLSKLMFSLFYICITYMFRKLKSPPMLLLMADISRCYFTARISKSPGN